MTSFRSPSSSQDPTNPPSFTISSRPFPLPCWSQEETVSLIDAYRDKWYSLRRGNLRASDWQEVADDVADRCPLSTGNPQKTATQCRHKMEKLRKRYRSEIQRAAAAPKGRRHLTSWVHFKQMDLMEKRSASSDPETVSLHQDEDEESEDQDWYNQDRRFRNLIDHRNGVQIKIPGRVPAPEAGLNWGKSSGKRGFGVGENGSRVEVVGDGDNPVKEMVAAIEKLGEGFVRVEKMKMEMAKEVESMRLEMELKRTEMIIESHQRLADSFSVPASKKLKRVPANEC